MSGSDDEVGQNPARNSRLYLGISTRIDAIV